MHAMLGHTLEIGVGAEAFRPEHFCPNEKTVQLSTSRVLDGVPGTWVPVFKFRQSGW
eukprot:SAG31_NODE_5210_length_2674_cov_1.231845_2_plen_56_part_01